MNQKSRWRSIPGAAFHDLLCGPAGCRIPRHFNVEDLSVCESDDEENVKRRMSQAHERYRFGNM
jgi:hypothetical protein